MIKVRGGVLSKVIEYARKLESEGKYDEALSYFEMAMDEKGCPFDIRKDIGQVLNKKREFEEALSCFDLVLSMDENHLESMFGRAISLMGLNRWVDAYDTFGRAIAIDGENANYWYYVSIIAKEYNNEHARKYFENFKKLDNAEFLKIRQQYKFGLIFKQRENELYRSKRTLNIDGFRRELKSYGLDDDYITMILRTVPYEELLDEMHYLKEFHREDIERNIIINEFLKLNIGENEIINMFELESVENLKKSIISMVGYDPFPKNDDKISVPLYRNYGLSKFIEEYSNDRYRRVWGVSGFNRFAEILKPMGRRNFTHRKLNYGQPDSGYYSNAMNNVKFANTHFNQAKKAISEKNYQYAFGCLDIALKNCPSDYYNFYNIKFYYATLLSKFKATDNKVLAYAYYDEIEDKMAYFKNKDIYILNKANLAYDLSFSYPKLINDSIRYYEDYLKIHPDDESVQYLLNSQYVYRLK